MAQEDLSDHSTLSKDWQKGLSLSQSTDHLMQTGKFADVWFCCKDHDETDKTDRIAAHKAILACRSSVFEAMFYGLMAEKSEEIHLPDIEKVPFRIFLKYVYTDKVDLCEDYAIPVMQIAHKYQVTGCVAVCSKFLQTILRTDNVCWILENALFFETTDLERRTTNFIDENACAVLDSEGFAQIGRDTLEYILKGNTFYAPEAKTIDAIDNWAVKQLQKTETEPTAANKRTAIGDAFQYLRWPPMTIGEFVVSQLKFGYCTNEEEKALQRYIIGNDETLQDLSFSSEMRIPRKSAMMISECKTVTDIKMDHAIVSEVYLTCTKGIILFEIFLSLRLSYTAKAECITSDLKTLIVKEYILKPPVFKFTLSPRVILSPSDSPYKLVVRVVVPSVSQPVPPDVSPGLLTKLTKNNKTSTFAQTDGDTSHGYTKAKPVHITLEAMKAQTCFIQEIMYINKSNRV